MNDHPTAAAPVRRARRGRPTEVGTRTRPRSLGGARLGEIVVGARRSRLVRRQLRSRGLAVVAAAIVAMAVVQRVDAADRATERWGATESVAVATRDLPAGALVTDGDVVLASWPTAVAPPDAIREVPLGRRLADTVHDGQPLVARQLAPGGRGEWAAALEHGESAVQVPLVEPMQGLDVRDVVDVVVATADTRDPDQLVVASDARVLEIGASAVTLAVRDGDAAPTAAAALIGATALIVRG